MTKYSSFAPIIGAFWLLSKSFSSFWGFLKPLALALVYEIESLEGRRRPFQLRPSSPQFLSSLLRFRTAVQLCSAPPPSILRNFGIGSQYWQNGICVRQWLRRCVNQAPVRLRGCSRSLRWGWCAFLTPRFSLHKSSMSGFTQFPLKKKLWASKVRLFQKEKFGKKSKMQGWPFWARKFNRIMNNESDVIHLPWQRNRCVTYKIFFLGTKMALLLKNDNYYYH